MSFFSRLFGRHHSTTQVTTVDRPFRIANPTIGFLNLQGTAGEALVNGDRRALSPLFRNSRVSTDLPPKCEVLFLYCTIDAQGKLVGSSATIRDLIADAGAYIAVVATENQPDSYIKGVGKRTDWHANIVMVLERKGDKFAVFFRQLFEAMFKGRSMLMAWVELAPQIPGLDQPDVPGTIMAAEAGHVTFR